MHSNAAHTYHWMSKRRTFRMGSLQGSWVLTQQTLPSHPKVLILGQNLIVNHWWHPWSLNKPLKKASFLPRCSSYGFHVIWGCPQPATRIHSPPASWMGHGGCNDGEWTFISREGAMQRGWLWVKDDGPVTKNKIRWWKVLVTVASTCCLMWRSYLLNEFDTRNRCNLRWVDIAWHVRFRHVSEN